MPRSANSHETITAISPLATDPNYRRVKVGRRTVATLRALDIESLKLQVGAPWTEPLARSAAEMTAVNSARRDAMNALGRRALSRGELIERLSRKKHEPAIIDRVVAELQADHWIDDEAYAQTLAEEVVRRKAASPQLIIAKLRSRHVDAGLAEVVAKRVLKDADPLQSALELARQRLRSMSTTGSPTAARRIAGSLARRGFDDDIIETVLARCRLNEAVDEH